MLNTINPRATQVGDFMLTASRQVWLAGLGAAVVTRDWAEKEAGGVFRNLIREGTAIESRAIRFVGDRLESSFVRANTIWKRARRNVTTTVGAYADTATALVREMLPTSLPKPEMPARVKSAAKRSTKRRTTRARKAASTRSSAPTKRTKKSAAKRG